MAWKDQGWRADTEGMSPSDDAPLLWGPCRSLPKTPPGLPAQRPTLAPTQGSWIHSSTTAAGRLPPGPKASGGSRVCLPGASRFPERERAHRLRETPELSACWSVSGTGAPMW